MKKKLFGCALSVVVLLWISCVANAATYIPVNERTSLRNNCNPSESNDYYYYLTDDGSSTHPYDEFWGDWADALIWGWSNGSSIDIWRWKAGDEVFRKWKCNTWERMSNIVKNWEDVLAFLNRDGCVIDRPNYTKTSNPTAIDAQIHFSIWYRVVRNNWPLTLSNSPLYYIYYGENQFRCYPGWGVASNTDKECKRTVHYWDTLHQHLWECQNYRIFWCGDGLVNSMTWTTYDNWTHVEDCDPKAPEWQNRKDWKTCSNSCEVIEPEPEDPECNNEYNTKTEYTETSAHRLKSTYNLCKVWNVTGFVYEPEVWGPREYRWKCENGGKVTAYFCNAKQQWCGDGEKNGKEDCDDWAKNWTDASTCDVNCKYKAPTCNSEYDGKNIYTSSWSASESLVAKYVNMNKLCGIWALTTNSFLRETKTWIPRIVYYWWCSNWTEETDSKACHLNQYRCGDGHTNKGDQQVRFIDGEIHFENCDPKDPNNDWVCKEDGSCDYKPATCGSKADKLEYNSGYDTPRITDNTPWLCGIWELSWHVSYDKKTWKYKWDCKNGTKDISCGAGDLWCGDGEKNGGEECDPNESIWEWDTWLKRCNNECKIYFVQWPECNSTYNNQTEYTNSSAAWLTANKKPSLCANGEVWSFKQDDSKHPRTFTWTCKTSWTTTWCIAYQEWCGDGVKNGKEECDYSDTSHNNRWDGCSTECKKTYNSWVCGSTYNGKTYYMTPDYVHLKGTTPWLCDSWDVVWFNKHYPTLRNWHAYTWQCKTEHGDVSAMCWANLKWCGDGNVDKAGPNDKRESEECDPEASEWKDRTDGIKCNASCKKERCGDGKINGDEQCDYKDPNETNWWNDWCSQSCERKIYIPPECDEIYHYTLRQGYDYIFWDIFHAKDADRRLYWNPVVNFIEQKDYNRWANPTFRRTNWDSDKMVPEDASIKVVESTPEYHIYDHPDIRSDDNLYIEYDLQYANRSNAPQDRWRSHKECVYYQISWCGDGKIDTDWEWKGANDKAEVCDPGSEDTKKAPDGQICNDKCQFEKVPAPVCNSKYNWQAVESLTEWSDLCSEWTYTTGSFNFDQTTNTWTWKCNNVAGVWKDCSATKIVISKGTPYIKKTLQNKVEVKEVWQKLDWEVKVTAKWWDITDFEIWDVMPNELKYLDWGYKDGKKPDWLTVTKKDNVGTSWNNKVYYWDVKWTLKEWNSLTIVVKSEVKEMPASWANILNIACVNDDGKVICDPEPVPAVCNSVYSGQTVKDLKETDGLCIIWKVTGFKFDEKTNKWTWWCNNEESTVNCWAKKEEVAWNWKMKKELITKWEVNSGDILDWKITVWAEWWNVKNLDITDSMPTILSYVRKSVKISKNPDDIKITKETVTNSWNGVDNEVLFNTQWILHDGNSIILTLKTKVLSMPEPGVEYNNVACSKPEDEPEWKCDDEPIPAVCNSAYSGQIVKDLKETDELCSVWKVTEFKFNEKTNKWTWKCDNEESTVSCWASKKTSKWRLDPLKTLIGSKEIKRTWDKVEWSLKVTAVWWDVTNFVMEDELPRVLGYQDYKVLHASGVTVQSPTTWTVKTWWKEAETIEWKVKWTLHSGDYVELKLVTYAKVMPDKDYNNVLCVRPEDNPEEEDCVPAEITPTKWKPDIKKILNKDKYVTETWQRLEWKVTVTAKWWDVDLDKITDKYPKKYVSFDGAEIDTWAWKNEGITIQKFALDEKEWIATWDVTWTLLSWNKIELLVYTKVHTMPDWVLKNIACVKPDPWNEECSEAKSYDLRIKKHILDKNWNKVKEITWNVNDKITYIIEFWNNGDESATVILKDYLPKWVKFESGKLVVNKKTTSWTTWLWNLDMMYEWETIQIDGVNINTYTEVKLAAKQSWTLTIVGTILEPKDENYNRTNFACIFVEESKKPVDCDDAHHEVENEIMCKSDIKSDTSDLCNGNSWSIPVTCNSDWWDADKIEILCDNVVQNSGTNISELKWTCTFSSDWDHSVQCKVNWSVKAVSWSNCEWTYNLKHHSCGWPSCFPAGTKVTMADWSKKNIEDVKVWDSVLSYNTDTNTNEQSVVQKRFVHEDNAHEMYELTINGNVLKVTDVHPFYVRKSASSKDYAWIEAKDLKVGDILLMSDGSLVKIEKINHYSNVETVYNLEVADNHDYFVDEWYLVHNKGCSWPCCNGWCNPTPSPDSDNYCETEKGKKDLICEISQPHCFNTNQWNFSIESWEYLPYYFNIYRDKTDYSHKYVFKDTSESCEVWDVNLKSMKCEIVVRDPKNTEVYTRDNIDCLTMGETWYKNDSLIGKWADAQNDLYKIDINSTRWRYWPTINYVKVNNDSQWKVSQYLWEYKFYVYLYKYDYCDEETHSWKTYTYDEAGPKSAPGCQSNFVLTDSYTVQKTPSGNLTASTKTLDKFKQVDWSYPDNLKPFSSYLNAIATSEYHPNQKVNDAMDAFIKKYEKLAVKVDISNSKFLSGTNVKKVPGKHIYFVDGEITVKWWSNTIETPFTIVQTSGKTTIKGDVNHNMMLLTKWNIEFQWDCTSNQNVKWIFYASGNLIRKWVNKNNRLENDVWCTQWWLNVKWVLIWNNFNELMRDSRSHLEYWFDENKWWKNAKTIMNWGSVVIEYSPSIFTKSTMPPGAEDFTTALSIYKN